MKTIIRTHGTIILDDNTYNLINGKAGINLVGRNKNYPLVMKYYKGKMYQLARLIIGCPKDKFVDHINGNSLDNRLNNLRIVTRTQNNQNKEHVGCHYNKRAKKYTTAIVVNKKRIWLGTFNTREEAISTYKKASLKYFGDYSYYRRNRL
ncbi:MAG: HNH endonuclease [Methanobrevibacter sp.]|jgi:hypothetical protein|nr:HNH endonuclease [Methanobrevibacter sp.]